MQYERRARENAKFVCLPRPRAPPTSRVCASDVGDGEPVKMVFTGSPMSTRRRGRRTGARDATASP